MLWIALALICMEGASCKERAKERLAGFAAKEKGFRMTVPMFVVAIRGLEGGERSDVILSSV